MSEKQNKDSKNKNVKKGFIGCLSIFCIAIIVAVLFGLFGSENEESPSISNIRVSKNDGINIRTGPGTNFDLDERGQLNKGEKLYVVKDSAEWIQFSTFPNDTSWTGWVKKESTVSKANWDLEKYLKEINELQRNLGFNLIDNVSISESKATLTVTDQWHVRNKQLRLQDAQTLWEIWADIHSPSEPDKARIQLVDTNGNQVGGSGFLAGSVIDVRD